MPPVSNCTNFPAILSEWIDVSIASVTSAAPPPLDAYQSCGPEALVGACLWSLTRRTTAEPKVGEALGAAIGIEFKKWALRDQVEACVEERPFDSVSYVLSFGLINAW